MWVTLYTDASVTREGASWAAWLRSDSGRIVESGPLENVADSNLAEMLAIIEGVRVGRERWPHASGFLVRTDSQTATTVLRYRAPPHRRSDFRALQEKLRELLAPAVRIKMTWVPGHQRPDNTRAWINDRVDNIARSTRRK